MMLKKTAAALVALFLLTTLGWGQEGTLPAVTIPRLATPPTLDGVLEPGEWDDALRVTGMIDQFSGQLAARQAIFWVKIDSHNVYIAQRSTVQPREWAPKTPPIWFDKGDSSFVVGLAPGRVNRGDEPSHYLLRVNLHGQVRTQEIAWKIKGVPMTFPHPAWKDASFMSGNAASVEGKVGRALSCSGRDAAWTELHAPALEPEQLTLSAWVFLNSDQDTNDGDGRSWIVSKNDTEWTDGHYALLLAGKQPGAYLNIGGGGGNVVSVTGKQALELKRWHHLAMTYDNQELKLYVDGVLSASKTINKKRTSGAGGFMIGGRPDRFSTPFTAGDFRGVVDEVRLYERPLPEAQVAALAKDPAQALAEGLVRAWSFDEAAVAGPRRSLGQAFNPDRTEWTSEVAIPLSDMKIDAIREGETWGLWFARDYEAAEQTASGRSSDWKFGDGRRHYGRAFYNNYRLAKEYVPARVSGLPTDPAPKPSVADTLGNAVECVPDFSFTGYHKGGGMPVSDSTLRQYGVYTGVGEKELTATSYDPITGDFYARLDISPLPEVQKAARGEIVIRKAGEAKPIVSHPIPDFRGGQRKVRFPLPELTPGVYQATASMYEAEGGLIGQARQNFIRFDHAKDLPWLGNTLGVSDKVLPPWTAIKQDQIDWSDRTGLGLAVWGRRYAVDGSGLFTGIDTSAQSGLEQAAKDILAGPVRVEVIADGKAVALAAAGLEEVKTAAHEASYRGELVGNGWRITTRGRLEYDGYVEHRLTIAPEGEGERRADRIRLVIPLKGEAATHLHAAAGNWFRSAVSSIALEGDGVLWHSGQSHGLGVVPHTQNWGGMMTVGDFKPYVWIGGPNRGLAFMADNDQGWVPDDEKKVHAIEVMRDGDKVNLVLNLVARPFAFTAPREIVFSLQATPIRPLEPDFRDRVARLHLQTAFPGFDGDGWCWNGHQFRLDGQHLVGGHGSTPYPINWERNISKRKQWEGHHIPIIFTPYQSQLNLMTFAEVDDPRMPPGKQASDVYGYIFPHIAAGCLEHGNLNIARPDLEYRLWCYQAWIKGTELKGMYFDQTEPILGANPAAGCGYMLDLPDRPQLHGKVQPGYLLTNTRAFYQRLRTLFVENGVDDPMIWIHDTDAAMISAFAFVGAFLDGENTPHLTVEQPWFDKKYDPERMQALSNHGKLGVGSVWLDMIQGDGGGMSNELKSKVWRCVQGYARVHDFADRWNYLKWAPFDPKKPMTFLPYWDPKVAAALKTDAPDVLASAYRQDDRLQVFVFNRSDRRREGVQITVDAAALGLPKERTVQATDRKGWGGLESDLPMDWKAAGTTGTLTLTIPPHDYRIILIEAQDKKQP